MSNSMVGEEVSQVILSDDDQHDEVVFDREVLLLPGNEPEYGEVLLSKVITSLQEMGYPICGRTSESDIAYESIDDLWHRVWYDNDTKLDWYDTASTYWGEQVPSTVDGMLGGFGSISNIDLSASRTFVRHLFSTVQPSWLLNNNTAFPNPNTHKLHCCDFGAGIGRVTKGLLLPLQIFHQCDLVEGSQVQLEAAPKFLGDDACEQCRFFLCKLQEWTPPSSCKYHFIWIQWVICYLTDVDCVHFLRRCADSLCDDGILCMKENTCSTVIATDSSCKTTIQNEQGKFTTVTSCNTVTTTSSAEAFVVDLEDCSLTRSIPYLICLAEQAGLAVVQMYYQTDFPEELFVVPMIAFHKKKSSKV
jgi:protein N-terminal methyltransferase